MEGWKDGRMGFWDHASMILAGLLVGCLIFLLTVLAVFSWAWVGPR